MDPETPTSTFNGLSPVELIFLGTGTSSSLPHVECLTAPPGDKPCKTCTSTLTPEGKRNIRRNTSCAFRMEGRGGQKVTVIIDAGKNFQASALEWFPKYGLRRIDALLITHPHADAMNGLDDLRGWTLGNAIQPHIDVYLSQETFTEVKRSFPYLVTKEYASGGGDVPEFKWHFITDDEPFEILDTGIRVTPFLVHHGRVFLTNPPSMYLSTPTETVPSTPTESAILLPLKQEKSQESEKIKHPQDIIHPYLCFGFKFGYEVVYISDVSHIPEEKWKIIESRQPDSGAPLPVLVLDCLGLRVHTSHMGLKESVETARRINASRTYLTGFGHRVSHDEYITIGEAVGGITKDLERLSETERAGLELIKKGKAVWVRPAHDGLRVFIEGDGRVWDESY
ncbi:beta-lactamase-like protein [Collybia nuda]|uniref:Beta-lactamase-like protein n=1 Tax=Collybia nuda TaxID=64659 RepID=A0A9P5XWY4_9AGAR|nr:beta-lactamase-like protein [Collybia nuda]